MTTDETEAGPLAGLTVLELSGSPGPAFGAALLADLGARVIVCEPPGGSALRRLGPEAVRRVWWPIAARNKLSLAVDATHPDAAPVLDRLVGVARMMLRDDDAPPWREAAARATNPPQDVHLFPTGADRPELWPWSTAPELAGAASGMMALTGENDGPPVLPEIPLAEHATGMLAAAAALFEQRAAVLEGRAAAPLGFALHEGLMRMIEWQLPVAAAQGRAELRCGNRFPMNANIGNVFRTRDGGLLTVSAATNAVAERMLRMIGGEALAADPRFRTQADRRAHMDEIEARIAEWMGRHDTAEALALVQANDVVVGPILDAGELMADPHVAAREGFVEVALPEGGSLPMPGVMPHGLGGAVRNAGPAPGADSDAVLGSLGFEPGEIAALRRTGVIWA
ncbi:CaiB/BaiF CoA transferase family protein [Falsiroseomonas bella]|nr:CaiB/BaiF CoA-transferase family protein [Falsiroseomonas bella]